MGLQDWVFIYIFFVVARLRDPKYYGYAGGTKIEIECYYGQQHIFY